MKQLSVLLLVACSQNYESFSVPAEIDEPQGYAVDNQGACELVKKEFCLIVQECERDDFTDCLDNFQTNICDRLVGIDDYSALLEQCIPWIKEEMTCGDVWASELRLDPSCEHQFVTGDQPQSSAR